MHFKDLSFATIVSLALLTGTSVAPAFAQQEVKSSTLESI